MNWKILAKNMICCTLIAALGLCLAACGQEAKPAASGNTEEPYEVVIEWLSVGNTPSEENLQKVEAYINEQTLPAIGCTVRLYPVEMGELANTNALSVSTGEKIDLVVSVFTGVGDLVNQGLVLPIGDYVEQYGANIRNKLGDSINNGLYNGELYGITTAFIQAEAYGFVARADLLEAAHVEIDTDKIYTLDELSAVFDQVAQANPGLYMVAGLGSGSDTYVNFLGTTDVLGASSASGTLLLSEDKNSTEVVNIYATDEYASFAQTMYDWAQKKYIPADADIYDKFFEALVNCWRQDWKAINPAQVKIPFIFVQLAPYGNFFALPNTRYPELREAQERAAKNVPDTYLTSITDVGNVFDIHPKEKKPVGERMYLLADKYVYGNHQVRADAPIGIQAERIAENQIAVTFEHGEGLYIEERDFSSYNGFTVEQIQAFDPTLVPPVLGKVNALRVVADGREVQNAECSVCEDRLIISSAELIGSRNICIQFAKTGFYQVNLYNGANLPVRPFEITLQNGDQ